jgi:hypothetical protein
LVGVGLEELIDIPFDQGDLIKIIQSRQDAQCIHVCPEPGLHFQAPPIFGYPFELTAP